VREVSVAELIRQSIDHFIRVADEPTLDEKYERALSIAGKYASEVSDLGANHDQYLIEVYGDFGK
jgi:hypothetical protein